MAFVQVMVDVNALQRRRERVDPVLQIELPHRGEPAEEVRDHHVETVGVEHLDHVVEASGGRDAGHAARARFRGADAADDADAVVLDRIPACDLEPEPGREHCRLDVVDRRRDLDQRRVVPRERADPLDLAIDLAGARQRERALAGDVLELQPDVQLGIDGAQHLAADILIGDVGDPRQPDRVLRLGWTGCEQRQAGDD